MVQADELEALEAIYAEVQCAAPTRPLTTACIVPPAA
jgi:hypothetical protein